MGVEAPFDPFDENMNELDMDFLNAIGIPMGDDDGDIHQILEFSAIFSQKADGSYLQFPGLFHGRNHIAGVSAGGNGQKSVALLPQGLDLP